MNRWSKASSTNAAPALSPSPLIHFQKTTVDLGAWLAQDVRYCVRIDSPLVIWSCKPHTRVTECAADVNVTSVPLQVLLDPSPVVLPGRQSARTGPLGPKPLENYYSFVFSGCIRKGTAWVPVTLGTGARYPLLRAPREQETRKVLYIRRLRLELSLGAQGMHATQMYIQYLCMMAISLV